MPMQIDTHVPTLATISEIADAFQLTPYDAAYFELAQRRRLPLATLDAAFGARYVLCAYL